MIDSLRFVKLHPAAQLPTRGSLNAAGLDLYSVEALTLPAGKRTTLRTGLSVAIPTGFYGRVAPRSGLAVEHGIDVLAGVIDSDYRGEIICVLINHGDAPVQIETGRRIAQLIVEPIITPKPVWAIQLDETERGSGGFGSTEKAGS
jgi:dUTP pyrophosphatase